jgi:hypothetical protein
MPNQQSDRQTWPKYMVNVTPNTNQWIEKTNPYMTRILGSDLLGAKTLPLLSATWAPCTTTTHGNTLRRYFDFCEEYKLEPLAATPAHMARYVV